MALNLPTGYVTKPPVATAEQNDQTNASSGMNAASCYPNIGINTGNYDPKVSDFSRNAIGPAKAAPLGWGGDNLVSGQTATVNAVAAKYGAADFNDTLGFQVTTASTVADAQIGATGFFNKTGQTIPDATWTWGTSSAS